MEMTALGAAGLAGIALGWSDEASWAGRRRDVTQFDPKMAADAREGLLAGWDRAVRASLLVQL